jgi:AraC-like DNA-binding protein
LLLSRNYAPSGDLAGYVRRYYIFHADLPDDFVLVDKLLSETTFVRVLLNGDWAAEVAPDQWVSYGPVPLMGANGSPRRVRVRGAFFVVGIAIRPCGWSGMFTQSACTLADLAVPLADLWGPMADRLHDDIAAASDDGDIVQAIEHILRERVARLGAPSPLPAMEAFEKIARHDSTILVREAARRVGLSIRQLERQCYANFGHSPKAILRRSRFLDMAQALRGFSAPSEQRFASLRYFDQSHLNREFRHFFQLTPGQFEKAVTPLFTAGLKLRADGFA